MNYHERFIGDRAKALATVLLTRRADLEVEETKQHRRLDKGLDFIVTIRGDEERGQRFFGIILKATMIPVTLNLANQQLKPTLGDIKPDGAFDFPVCVFYYTVKNDVGYYTWVEEPVVMENQMPELRHHSVPDCAYLTNDSLDEIIGKISAWYESSILQ